jgi:hypothetical protein
LASDSASLQFTMPAPDPGQAGETVVFQALAVNTGAAKWKQGSYYWAAEVYDLEYRFLARSKEISPAEDAAAGGVAAISLPFPVPESMSGRKLYRVFLIKDAQTLLVSDYKPFQVLPKELPPPTPPPEAVEYRVEGNVTVSFKDTSEARWKHPSGATDFHMVGKIKASSYLANAYFIHQPGKVVDPFIVLFSYYAPWGRVYAGDISPTLSALSVNGQGLRGLMLEQQKGAWDWSLLGGQTVTSQGGTATANGRYARSLYAGKLGAQLPGALKVVGSAFLSSDETASLSNAPDSPNYRGPSLLPQKNQGAGLSLAWEPRGGLSFLFDYQRNDYYQDSSRGKVTDSAWKGEVRFNRKLIKFKAYAQRAGPKFVAFSAPAVIGDRLTYDATLGIYPAGWYSLNLALDQYSDNLANDPNRTTTTQRTVNAANAFQFPSGTSVNLSGTMTTAKGKPASALDNQSTTASLGLSQAWRKHSLALNAQAVQFRDKAGLAHNLDTQTYGLNVNLSFPWTWKTSLGASRSVTKDKIDAAQRTNLTASLSFTVPLGRKWSSQYWGSLSQTRNNSTLLPSDVRTLALNSEFTWTPSKRSTFAFGPGYNENKDKYVPEQSHHETVITMRYSYSF